MFILDTGDVPFGRTSREGQCFHYFVTKKGLDFHDYNEQIKRPISINWLHCQ